MDRRFSRLVFAVAIACSVSTVEAKPWPSFLPACLRTGIASVKKALADSGPRRSRQRISYTTDLETYDDGRSALAISIGAIRVRVPQVASTYALDAKGVPAARIRIFFDPETVIPDDALVALPVQSAQSNGALYDTLEFAKRNYKINEGDALDPGTRIHLAFHGSNRPEVSGFILIEVNGRNYYLSPDTVAAIVMISGRENVMFDHCFNGLQCGPYGYTYGQKVASNFDDGRPITIWESPREGVIYTDTRQGVVSATDRNRQDTQPILLRPARPLDQGKEAPKIEWGLTSTGAAPVEGYILITNNYRLARSAFGGVVR